MNKNKRSSIKSGWEDHYTRTARQQNRISRAVFKLEQMDNNLFAPNQSVLDLGCAPGSWLKYASQKVGKAGLVLGVDITPLSINIPNNAIVINGDLYEQQIQTQIAQYAPFDIILSDMAPATTGIKSLDAQQSLNLAQLALNISQLYGKQSATLLCKVFQGQKLPQLRQQFKNHFKQIKTIKPKASRPNSTEIYLLGQELIHNRAPQN